MLDLRTRRSKIVSFRDARDDTRAACIRIARRLRIDRATVIGLMPAGKVSVRPVALLLGGALVELSGARVALVDSGPPPRPDAENSALFASRWVAEKLALFTPTRKVSAGELCAQLSDLVTACRRRFAHAVFDLSAFEPAGELAYAASHMDAVAALARAKKTRERELLRLAAKLEGPDQRFVGAICC